MGCLLHTPVLLVCEPRHLQRVCAQQLMPRLPLPVCLQAATPVWQLLLQQALVHGVDAVIDAGALLAGVNLRCGAAP
jgi:hypothetical protein